MIIILVLLQQYVATDRVEKKLTAEDLIRATKPITIATARAVAAGNSGKQEDVIVAANMGRKAMHDLLLTAKVSVCHSVLSATPGCIPATVSLLLFAALTSVLTNCCQTPRSHSTDSKDILY